MVTHVSDASFAPENPKDDLADQVLAKLQDESVGKAYVFLKSSVQNVFDGRDEDKDGVVDKRDVKTDVPMNSKEKEAFWNSLVKELEEKRPGVTQQLASIWLGDFKSRESKDAPMPASWVRSVASDGHLMDKTFAGAAAKDIDIVKNLFKKDDAIDEFEVERNRRRQLQKPREEFVQDTVKKAIFESATSPFTAVGNLYDALTRRAETESQDEKNATYKAVADALKDHPDIVAKLATGFVQKRFNDIDSNNDDRKADSRITADEIADYNPESVGILFMNYVRANFKDIAETSVNDRTSADRSRLTMDELNNHVNRLNRKSK